MDLEAYLKMCSAAGTKLDLIFIVDAVAVGLLASLAGSHISP